MIPQFIKDHSATVESGVAPEVVAAICQSFLVKSCFSPENSDQPITLVESLGMSAKAIPSCYSDEHQHGLPVVPSLSLCDESSQTYHFCSESLTVLSFWMASCTGWQDVEKVFYQLVLPEELRSMVLTSLHMDTGHMGVERTLDLFRSRFFWPRMAADVEAKVRTCERCVRRKALSFIICMDYLFLEPDQSNTKDILVLTDHFTKYAVAIPTANQKAKRVARCLWENFIVHYVIPERLHTDKGPDFE